MHRDLAVRVGHELRDGSGDGTSSYGSSAISGCTALDDTNLQGKTAIVFGASACDGLSLYYMLQQQHAEAKVQRGLAIASQTLASELSRKCEQLSERLSVVGAQGVCVPLLQLLSGQGSI